jgi:hypothetical protein
VLSGDLLLLLLQKLDLLSESQLLHFTQSQTTSNVCGWRYSLISGVSSEGLRR